jgi:hypothetical protein
MAESAQSRDFPAMSDGDRGRGEYLRRDGFLKNRKCSLENSVFVGDSGRRDASLHGWRGSIQKSG